MVGACYLWGRRELYRFLAGQPEGKRSLGRYRHRREDIAKMGVKELGWKSVDCVDLAQNSDKCGTRVNTVMKILIH
jgi:hypothetical protein